MVEWIGTQKKHLGKRKNEIWVETRWNCVWRLKSDYVQYHMYHSVWCGTATCRQVPFLVRKLFFGRKWLSRVLIPASAISASPLQLESSCVICIKKKVDPWHSRSPCDLRHHITEVIKPGRRIVQDDFQRVDDHQTRPSVSPKKVLGQHRRSQFCLCGRCVVGAGLLWDGNHFFSPYSSRRGKGIW